MTSYFKVKHYSSNILTKHEWLNNSHELGGIMDTPFSMVWGVTLLREDEVVVEAVVVVDEIVGENIIGEVDTNKLKGDAPPKTCDSATETAALAAAIAKDAICCGRLKEEENLNGSVFGLLSDDALAVVVVLVEAD